MMRIWRRWWCRIIGRRESGGWIRWLMGFIGGYGWSTASSSAAIWSNSSSTKIGIISIIASFPIKAGPIVRFDTPSILFLKMWIVKSKLIQFITSFIKLIKLRSALATSSSSSRITFGSGVKSIPADWAIVIKYLNIFILIYLLNLINQLFDKQFWWSTNWHFLNQFWWNPTWLWELIHSCSLGKLFPVFMSKFIANYLEIDF